MLAALVSPLEFLSRSDSPEIMAFVIIAAVAIALLDHFGECL